MKTSELFDEKLDWAVSYALGHNPMKDFHSHGMTWRGWWETTSYIDTKPNEYRRVPRYSINWEQGGPIIEREGIAIDCLRTCGQIDGWIAATEQLMEDTEDEYSVPIEFHGPTPLIAAMRCYVASKLGDEVDIPKELLGEQ